MDSSKMFDKDFEKLDWKSDFDFQSWSFEVYLMLCEKNVEYYVDKTEPIIIDKSSKEENVKYEKWKENFIASGYIITLMTKIYAKQFT